MTTNVFDLNECESRSLGHAHFSLLRAVGPAHLRPSASAAAAAVHVLVVVLLGVAVGF